MPFKIGDKVRIVHINRDPVDTWSKQHIGKVFFITKPDSVWDGVPSWYGPKFEDGTYNPFRWKESELELVKEELKFEVGKKYKGRVINTVATCLFVSDKHALLRWRDGSEGLWDIERTLVEYVPPPPPPVKKEGWIRVYEDLPNQPTGSKHASEVYSTKELAEKPTYNTRKFFVAHVTWEEPGKPEDVDGDEI